MANVRQQYIRNPENRDVWIYTARLRDAFPNFEEVWAENAAEAMTKPAIPDPAKVSVDQLEALDKADLIVFASRLQPPVKLPDDATIDTMLGLIKAGIFGIEFEPPVDATPATPAAAGVASAPGAVGDGTTKPPVGAAEPGTATTAG